MVQRSEIEDRPNLLVSHVEHLCSTLPGTIGDAISTRGQSGTTYAIQADDAHSVGYQQFENVAFFTEHSTEFSKRVGIGQVTRLSVLPRLELFLRQLASGIPPLRSHHQLTNDWNLGVFRSNGILGNHSFLHAVFALASCCSTDAHFACS